MLASSTSWSRTSTSSSTSDPAGHLTRTGALGARLRLVHPFPSALNGVAAFGIALVAGGSGMEAARLGAAMLLIQFAIGTCNDLVDEPRDHARVPAKALPSGLVGRRTAMLIAIGAGTGGLILASLSGPPTMLVAAAGLGCGLAYDILLSRTPFSWLPLTLALPLVPVYAWYGVVGSMPSEFGRIIPLAMVAGAGLAIGNAIVDLQADRARGRRTVAVALGRVRAWVVHVIALLGVAAAVVVLMPPGAGSTAAILVAMGIAASLIGVAGMRTMTDSVLRLAWGLEAAGVAAMGVGWVIASATRL